MDTSRFDNYIDVFISCRLYALDDTTNSTPGISNKDFHKEMYTRL